MYLQHILKQKSEETLLYRFFNVQLENPTKNDWVSSAVGDLITAGIQLELNEIANLSEEKYKYLCKQNVSKLAFEYLIEKQINKNKKTNIKYECLELSKYLQENDFGFSVKEKENLFKCRMNEIDVKGNRSWKYENLNCMACKEPNQIENQQHVLLCKALLNKNCKVSYIPSYNDLFSDNIEEQIYTSNIICENLRISRVPM